MNAHIDYILHLADTTLILAHRNSEWCGHGPVLEQDIAITNISLDLLGQARNFYQHAAELINAANSGKKETEDSLAYMRDEREYKNTLLVELEKGDWGKTVLRQFLFSAFQELQLKALLNSTDKQLAAIAEKSLKETAYHIRWSSEWVIRLGDGTDESHSRMIKALDEVWEYTGGMFEPAPYEKELEGTVAVDLPRLKDAWMNKVKQVLVEATLPVPGDMFMQQAGKTGIHTESLGIMLAEMQSLQRAIPNAEW